MKSATGWIIVKWTKLNGSDRYRRINNFIELWYLVALGGLDICVSSTNFQENDISWPKQPLTKKVQKFNMIFHYSTPNFFFHNIRIKLNSNAWMTLKSLAVVFQASKLLQPQWPQQPQQPQCPKWPQQAHSIKKITDPNDLIIPSIQMTNTGPFLWNRSSKIQIATDTWYTFCWRLLRPADVIFLEKWFWHPFFWRLWRTGMVLLTKVKGHKSNVHYSGFPKHLQTKSSLHISICQSKLKHKYLTLDTLYLVIYLQRRWEFW